MGLHYNGADYLETLISCLHRGRVTLPEGLRPLTNGNQSRILKIEVYRVVIVFIIKVLYHLRLRNLK